MLIHEVRLRGLSPFFIRASAGPDWLDSQRLALSSQSLLHQGIGRTGEDCGGEAAGMSQSLLHQGIGRTAPPFLIQQNQ